MNDKDGQREALPDERSSADGDPSVDSLMRAVAHVSTVDMPHRSTQAASEAPAAPATLLEFPPPLPRVGEVLGGRYELTELLGAGGMGAVFAARHRGTGREVAIKVLLPQQGSERQKQERITRFVREARAAGRIRHPNVVDVYDVDGDTNAPYLVMERLYGESLWQRIKRGALPVEEAVTILIAAMRGVAEVHRQGVVHRDLKPDNIYLASTAEGVGMVPKVLDFGVSRIMVREGTEPRPTTLTRAGYILGTPSYMPLEQLRGEPDVDARADVYALGVILYEALCGERPYEARNDHELVIRMVTEAATPLSQRLATIDTSLAFIVGKALARDAKDRFQDVESFVAALSGWLEGERNFAPAPIVAPAAEPVVASAPPRSASVRPSNRVVRALIAVVLVALGAGYWLLSNGAPSPDVAKPAPGARVTVPAEPPPAAVGAGMMPALVPPAVPTVAVEPALPESPPPAPKLRGVGKSPRPSAPEKPDDDRATTLNPEEF